MEDLQLVVPSIISSVTRGVPYPPVLSTGNGGRPEKEEFLVESGTFRSDRGGDDPGGQSYYYDQGKQRRQDRVGGQFHYKGYFRTT